MNKIYKYRLLIILAIIAGIMGVTKWQYRNVNWEEARVVITPTVTPTSAPQINEKYPLWSFIPFSGEGYMVERYIEPMVLAVKIDNVANKKLVLQEIYKWMNENKVATESHKLIFEKN